MVCRAPIVLGPGDPTAGRRRPWHGRGTGGSYTPPSVQGAGAPARTSGAVRQEPFGATSAGPGRRGYARVTSRLRTAGGGILPAGGARCRHA